ncbi:MAG: hypothetical protein WBP79_15360 [Candidatus Acidiferrales bacterium]
MNRIAFTKSFFVIAILAAFLGLAACGGGGNAVVIPPPPGNFTNESFINSYAFSYQGSDSGGVPLAVAGELVADGSGKITSGILDINDFGNIGTALPILAGSTYNVGADGRSSATLNIQGGTITLQFTLSSNSHALVTEFDSFGSGSGTIDQQDTNVTSTQLSGNYAFIASGVDFNFNETTIGGNFATAGAVLTPGQAVWDAVDAGTFVVTDDNTLSGTTPLDAANAGRGQLSLTSTQINGFTFVFGYYIVDATHIKLIGIDQTGTFFLAGDAYKAPSAPAQLANSNYAFTVSGEAAALTPVGIGGVFTSNGSGNITGGVQDLNNNASGNAHLKQTLQAAAYTVDPTFARIDLRLNNGNIFEYAAYPTSSGTVILIEIDGKQAVTSGIAYRQTATTAVQGNYAINLTGLAIKQSLDFVQDVVGQVNVASGGAVTGTIDINNLFQGPPVPNISLSSNSKLPALDSPVTGRGNPFALQSNQLGANGFALSYYVVDANTVLLVEMDSVRVTTGIMVKQP